MQTRTRNLCKMNLFSTNYKTLIFQLQFKCMLVVVLMSFRWPYKQLICWKFGEDYVFANSVTNIDWAIQIHFKNSSWKVFIYMSSIVTSFLSLILMFWVGENKLVLNWHDSVINIVHRFYISILPFTRDTLILFNIYWINEEKGGVYLLIWTKTPQQFLKLRCTCLRFGSAWAKFIQGMDICSQDRRRYIWRRTRRSPICIKSC